MPAVPTPAALGPHRGDPWFALLCAAVVPVTALAAYIGKGNLAVAAAPTLAVALGWLIWRLPARTTLLVLLFLGLTLECAQEIPAAGLWRSPLYRFGEILLSKANDWTHVKPLIFTGVDVVVFYLIVVLVWRRATGSTIDIAGRAQTAGVMALASGISFASILWIWGWGLAQGGDFGNALLQVYKLLYIPLLFFVCQAALRGPPDQAAVAKVIVGAALCRSALAIYVRNAVVVPPNAELPYATTHGDSMLFASATALLIALANERVGARVRGRSLAILAGLALLLAGMIANQRRVVWVELAAIVVTFYFMSGWTPLKRRVTRLVICTLPILAVYMAAGWGSESGALFAPVRLARSVLDSSSDSSTLWRDLENIDLILTIGQNPVFGTGLGHGYLEAIKLPDVSAQFPLYRYVPHNSLLGFLGFAGVLGFSLMWCILTVGLFLAARSYYRSAVPLDRAMALWAIATFVGYFNSVYADMGQFSWAGVFTVCPALALVSKLAVASGAWPARLRKPLEAPPETVALEWVTTG